MGKVDDLFKIYQERVAKKTEEINLKKKQITKDLDNELQQFRKIPKDLKDAMFEDVQKGLSCIIQTDNDEVVFSKNKKINENIQKDIQIKFVNYEQEYKSMDKNMNETEHLFDSLNENFSQITNIRCNKYI